MQLRHKFGILMTSVSVAGLAALGCVQQKDEVEAQENPAVAQVQAPAPNTQTETQEPDVPYVPTPEAVVEQMLAIAKVGKNDVLYDLGSGDGRIVITAAQKFGTRGIGIDINPERIKEANQNAQKAGVTDKVQFRQQDLFKTDVSKASVVTLYLLPDINLKLRPQLFKQLKPGTRVVSHDFDMGDWKPERVVEVDGPNRRHTIYYWVVPEKVPANLQGSS